MPYFNLHDMISALNARKGPDVFVLQIGAMDGKTFDPIHGYVEKFGWGGVMVEPMPGAYAALCDTYADNARITPVCAAIAEHNGTITMHHVPTRHVQAKAVPNWAGGLSSFYNDRNAMNFPAIEPFVAACDVPCMTVDTLLRDHGIDAIDMLQIDAEGHDYHILKQFDLVRVRPAIINIEYVNLPKSEQAACKKHLDQKNYLYAKGGYDLLAVSYEFLYGMMGQS